jgi:hypothetical protein
MEERMKQDKRVDLEKMNPEEIARLDFRGDKDKLEKTPQMLKVKANLKAGPVGREA